MQNDTNQALVTPAETIESPFLMTTSSLLRASVCLSCVISAPVFAQDQSNEPSDTPEVEIGTSAGVDRIVVTSRRIKGQLDVEQAPLLELSEEDIAAEGVTSIADLVTQVSNQTGSARGRGGGGRPVILVNGIRIGSFRELASYPPEALEKVEVFPEEVAQRFGFSADRRVVNLILKENYSSKEVELEFEGPSRGGYRVTEQELGYLQIAGGARINANLEVRDVTLLTEAEREIDQTESSISNIASDPDQAEFRSLVADSFGLEANLSWAKAIISSGTSLSANANYDRNESRSLSGLNSVTLTDGDDNSVFRTFGEETPLERRSSTDTISVSGSATQPLGALRLTATINGSVSENETEIDQRFDTTDLETAATAGELALDGLLPSAADAGFDVATSRNTSAVSKATLRGPIAFLPGGDLTATVDLGYGWTRIESADTRSLTEADLTRGDLEAGVNVVVPITSRRNAFADALGSFTLNGQFGINELSDFGTLTDWSTGLTWAPFDNLDLTATYIQRESAPSLGALGNPQITTLNAPVFDFTLGETVLTTVISGGNPDLVAEKQSDWRFAANWGLPFWENTRVTAEYIRNRSENVTGGFPVLTDATEAAFGDRVTRDAGGTLLSLDRRSVTYAETRANRLQFRLFTRGSIGAGERGQRGGRPGAGGPPRGSGNAEGQRSGRPSAGAGGPPSQEQREQFMKFRERLCADDGLDVLKRLVAAIESGEDLSEEFPGFSPERLERMLSRARDENGEISEERLAAFRERFCSMDPSQMRGRGGAQGGESSGGQQRSRGGGSLIGAAFGGGGQRPRGWRYFFNLTHTIELDNTILIASGIPELDLLDGDAVGAFGQSRTSSRLEAGLFGNGMGMRLSGRYTGSARIDGSGLPGSTDLFFSDIATFDIRVFSNIGELVGKNEGALKNLRVSLRADNIFDTRRDVTDGNGDTPINYQPFVIDPTGRYVGIDIRKLF